MTDISSMTDSELNEALAEWRGWHKRQTGTGYPWYWCEPDYMEDSLYRHSGKSVMMCSEWQPTTDLNQAVECAEKWKNVAEERNIAIVYTWSGYHIQFRVGNKIVGETKVDDLPRALCEAVLVAVRGEGNKFETTMKRVLDENIGAWKALADGEEGKGSQLTESHGK